MNGQQLQMLGIDEKWLEPINQTFNKYDISTPVRQAFFIGQRNKRRKYPYNQ